MAPHKLQELKCEANFDNAQNSTTSEYLAEAVSSGSLVDKCHRCTVELSSFLFDLSVINGCKRRLATYMDKTEILLLLTTLNNKLAKIATDYAKKYNKIIILKDIADILEKYHSDLIISINSLFGKRSI